MSPTATGRLLSTPDGENLVLERRFNATIEDVWASITESERTARWFAAWWGDAGPRKTVRYRMVFEGEEAPEGDVLIEVCEPPKRLIVQTPGEGETWRLEATLSESEGVTTLTFIHHLVGRDQAGFIGPGWDYYLDMLVASRDDLTLPAWDDYFPTLQEFYENLQPE